MFVTEWEDSLIIFVLTLVGIVLLLSRAGFYHTAALQNRRFCYVDGLDPLSSQLTITREVRHLRVYLAKEDHQDDLFVYDRPGQLTALGFSAVSWPYFQDHKAELLQGLRQRLYQRIIAIDRVRYNSKPEDAPLIRDGYRLAPTFL